jgi:hypothetical protein
VKSGKHKPFAAAHLTVRNNQTGKNWKSPKRMRVFVDSGASITILPPSALPVIRDQIGNFDMVPARIQTANGVKEAVAMRDVSLCLDESCFRGNVLITDGIDGDVLIGSDFLTKAGCTVDFKKKTMKCKGGTLRFRMEE